ncbi:hypothetical protein XA68_14904 [Ophiocordyceps unilateralis]|uniref:FAD-binding FR-type domain-containing protein n=1 Tax=Ophiocordyceps unilateralis TaxID=268505 RepID=A0A2A9P884_OPHUN|nr:hypothetical protein XA68_14904 [Ophiocordyceps unilateralis]
MLAGLIRLLSWLLVRDSSSYVAVPTSPVAKARRRLDGRRLRYENVVSRIAWWLDDRLGFGRRDEWLIGFVWFFWLLALCLHHTGTDFLHFTKRLGAVAVSQLPVLYLLSLKGLNPFALAFGSSHERLNRFHGVLGRLVGLLLVLHAACYNYFFVVAGIWPRRLLDWIVVCGVVAALGLAALGATAMASVRRASYRVFFVTHVLVALMLPLLIFFHAPSVRIYLIEALLALLFDLGVRKLRSVHSPSTLVLRPDANLVAVEAPVPPHMLRAVSASAGSHVYLSIPPGSGRSASGPRALDLFDFLYNPFTVAAVDHQRASITLVARVRHGPMTRTLARLASSTPAARKVSLTIDGPYGSMARQLRHLVAWSPTRVLVIAGGVGATFSLPIYRFLREQLPSARIRLIWSVRGLADAAWASDAGLLPEDDRDVQLFISGGASAPYDTADTDSAVEMRSLRQASSPRHRLGRPDLETIVDDVFRQGLEEPVAVLVCGPAEMAAEVRRRVRPWVMLGRDVWWHSESFGW